jgi:hypothetical protein
MNQEDRKQGDRSPIEQEPEAAARPSGGLLVAGRLTAVLLEVVDV